MIKRVTLTAADLKWIKPSPIRHAELPADLLERARAIWKLFRPFWHWCTSFEQFERNLLRDMHPEREIAVCEWMAAEFREFNRLHPYASKKRQQKEHDRLFVESLERWPLMLVKAS